MWLEDHFGSGSTLQRNERVRLAASFWNNVECSYRSEEQDYPSLGEARHPPKRTA
jgi:hypothetical protein